MPWLSEDKEIIIFTPGGNGSGGAGSSGSVSSIVYDDPKLSTDVGDIEFPVSADVANIEISCGGKSFFSVNLSPFNGKCRLYDAGSLIADYMRSSGLSFGQFVISEKISNSSITLKVLLSDRVTHSGFSWAQKYPLNSSDIATIPSYGRASVYLIDTEIVYPGSMFTVYARGFDSDGVEQEWAVNFPPSRQVDDKIFAYDFCPNDLIPIFNEDCRDQDFEFDCITFIRVQRIGDGLYICHSFYVIDDPDTLMFRFLNNFGLMEYIYFHAESSPDLKEDAQLAFIGNRVVKYDVEHSQSFSVQVSNLTSSEWERISQFIASREIYDAYGRRILLSDVSSDIGKSYEELGSFKFSYRYADSRIIAD